MKKEVIEKIKQDSKIDSEVLSEIMNQEKSTEAIVSRFSSKISGRYSAEFEGVLSLAYNKITGNIDLFASNLKAPAMTFSETDLSEIPNQIMMLRQRKKKSQEVKEWEETRNVPIK